MARVTGSRIVMEVPFPCPVRSSTEPPIERTRLTTASTPTPRPEAAPAPPLRTPAISADRTAAHGQRREYLGLATGEHPMRSIPRPSSVTRITTDERSRAADSVSRPVLDCRLLSLVRPSIP